MRIKEMQKEYPFPWVHEVNGKVSAVVAANGHVVCGSLICESSTAMRQAHAFIVENEFERNKLTFRLIHVK